MNEHDVRTISAKFLHTIISDIEFLMGSLTPQTKQEEWENWERDKLVTIKRNVKLLKTIHADKRQMGTD